MAGPNMAGPNPNMAVSSVFDSRARDPGFDSGSSQILSLSLFAPLIQDGQLSAAGESTCTKYWLTA